jgi:hypothetical protein
VRAPDDLLDSLAGAVASNGGSWFHELDRRQIRVRFRGGQVRARCFLYRFDLDDGRLARPVMVKVRHSDPALRRLDRFEQRPVLAPVRTMSDEETARCEYEGLRQIANALAGADTQRFGVLRPLAWLPEQSAIVTDLVAHPTLRSVVLGRSRSRLGRRTPLGEAPWHNAGAWLERYHRATADGALPPRCASSAEAGDLLVQFAGFLRDRLGARGVLDEIRTNGPEIARRALPGDLPLVTGHGDFVATNMFTEPSGRITVFDPLPLWQVPAYQDLATLVVGLHVLPLQAATQGLAFADAEFGRYEAALHRGYFRSAPVPHTALAAFQLLAVLDRWSSLVSQQVRRGGVGPQLREARIRIASCHYHREARRLLARIETGSEAEPSAGTAAGGSH